MDQTTGSGLINRTTGTATSPARTRADGERSIEEIRQNIEQVRGEITNTVDQLGDKLRSTFDWKHYIGEYPFVAVGGAAFLGFLVARRLLKPKRSNTDQMIHNLVNTVSKAFQPKKEPFYVTALMLGGKYLLDQYQKQQQEQEEQRRLEEQLQALQLHQQMLQGYPPQRGDI